MRELKRWYNSLPPTKSHEDINSRLYCILYVIKNEGQPVKGLPGLYMFDDCFAVCSVLNSQYDTLRVTLSRLRIDGYLHTKKIDKRYYIKL